MKWEIEFYENKKGSIPVKEFLETLPYQEKAKAIWVIDLLEKTGTNLAEPYVKHINKSLWELRMQNNRILYFLDNKTFVLVHGYKKKTNKLPKGERERACQRMEEYFKRRKK